MSLALLNRDDVNVICVDWMLGASPPYSQAVANTRLVGAMIAHLIKLIQVQHSKMELIQVPKFFFCFFFSFFTIKIVYIHRKVIQINLVATKFIL